MRPMPLAIVGVMGSSRERWETLSLPLGRWLAAQACHLLTGGGGGVMAAVSEAFAGAPGRSGLVIGVLPGHVDEGYRYAARSGYPNPWVDIAIRTHLPLSGIRGRDTLSRNHVNVLTADCVIVLPGGEGTRAEADLALRYGRPVILFGPQEALQAFPESLERTLSLARVQAFVAQHLFPAAQP
jgi:uncharacterized protein (TIGR00725 family)